MYRQQTLMCMWKHFVDTLNNSGQGIIYPSHSGGVHPLKHLTPPNTIAPHGVLRVLHIPPDRVYVSLR